MCLTFINYIKYLCFLSPQPDTSRSRRPRVRG